MTRQAPGPDLLLTLSCPDRPGIVHAVSGFVLRHGGNIVASQQYGDSDNERFFMRLQFTPTAAAWSVGGLEADFTAVGQEFAMDWQLTVAATPARTVVLVSRLGHCLNDLLFRASTGTLPVVIPAVVSNHRDHEGLVRSFGIPFHHVPVTPETRAGAEERLRELVADLGIDLVVLARYMQVFSDDLCQQLAGRAINIHHSFLPSFKGARPYHQAHERGVKLIGATAHYVTAALDEGPIIEQDVVRADHWLGPSELAALGHDVEAQVLSRAVKWHAERRVLLNGARTVVFR